MPINVFIHVQGRENVSFSHLNTYKYVSAFIKDDLGTLQHLDITYYVIAVFLLG